MILDSIFFSYGDEPLLKGCYLESKKGTVTGIVGRNGSGKSTLFKIASGQLNAASGITIFGEQRLHKKSKRIRFSLLSYLPQEAFLPGSIKVKTLLKSFPDLRSDEFLQQEMNQKVGHLSTGNRRYLEVMLILSLQKPFIILDEPFTGLSPILIERVIAFINSRKKEAGIIVSDHYSRYLLPLCDSLYTLENGILQRTSDQTRSTPNPGFSES